VELGLKGVDLTSATVDTCLRALREYAAASGIADARAYVFGWDGSKRLMILDVHGNVNPSDETYRAYLVLVHPPCETPVVPCNPVPYSPVVQPCGPVFPPCGPGVPPCVPVFPPCVKPCHPVMPPCDDVCHDSSSSSESDTKCQKFVYNKRSACRARSGHRGVPNTFVQTVHGVKTFTFDPRRLRGGDIAVTVRSSENVSRQERFVIKANGQISGNTRCTAQELPECLRRPEHLRRILRRIESRVNQRVCMYVHYVCRKTGNDGKRCIGGPCEIYVLIGECQFRRVHLLKRGFRLDRRLLSRESVERLKARGLYGVEFARRGGDCVSSSC